jgi:hypothetical protein
MNRPRIRKRKLIKRAAVVLMVLPLVPWGLGWAILGVGLEAWLKRLEAGAPSTKRKNPLKEEG